MTWLTWRQFRTQAVTAAVALAAFAILLAATGPGLASRFAGSRITGCHGSFAGGGCDSAAIAFLNRLAATTLYPAVYALGLVVIVVAPEPTLDSSPRPGSVPPKRKGWVTWTPP